MDLSKLITKDKEEIKGSAYTLEYDKQSSVIFINDLKETVKDKGNAIYISHEIVHVIQNICNNYQMNIEEEKEHMAYIMTYVLEQIFDIKREKIL